MRILLLCALVAGASAWSYIPGSPSGPANWPGVCGTGTEQSPIDIDTGSAVTASYTSFSFGSGYTSVNVDLINDAKIVRGVIDPTATGVTVSGGGLTGTYKLAEFQMHWGSANNKGSEHRIDGAKFSMEVQFVHYKSTYASLNAALSQPGGVAIISRVYQVTVPAVSAWSSVIGVLPTTPSTNTITGLNVQNLMGNVVNAKYFRYEGSLTQPDCNEDVIWTVFKDPSYIGSGQIADLRTVKDGSTPAAVALSDNFRPPQSLNSRTVDYYT